MSRSKRMGISFGLGLLSIILFILGAEPFEGSGAGIAKGILSGSIVVALGLAIGQFLICRKGGAEFRVAWPGLVATDIAVLMWVLLIAAAEKPETLLAQGVPLLAAGVVGSLAGSVVAALVVKKKVGTGN